MAVATGELVQVTFVMDSFGQTVENVFMMRERTGLSTTDQIKQSVRDFWEIYRTRIVDDVNLTELRAKIMTPAQLDTMVFHANSGQDLGGLGGDLINNMLCCCVTHRTGTAGKRHRGRTYMPGLPVGSVQDATNRITSAALTAITSMWEDVDAVFDDEDGTDTHLAFGIYSKLIGGTSPYTVAGWQSTSEHVPRSIVSVQRRRKLGVGI